MGQLWILQPMVSDVGNTLDSISAIKSTMSHNLTVRPTRHESLLSN